MTNVPEKLAFVHLMRTGGTSLGAAIRKSLERTHRLCDSWAEGFKRDWTHEELLSFAASHTPIFVHNHVVNWTAEIVEAYHRAGFVVFSAVRPIGDQLCSLYHWCRQQEPGVDFGSLDEFVKRQLRDESVHGFDASHWEIPEWWRSFDACTDLTLEPLDDFLRDRLHLPGNTEIPNTNATGNPGFDAYRREGIISDETCLRLESSRAHQSYREVVAHYELDSIESSFQALTIEPDPSTLIDAGIRTRSGSPRH